MASQIDLLSALQEIDQRLQSKGLALQELRRQTTAFFAEIEAKEREVEARKERLLKLETDRHAAELHLRAEEDKIKEKRVRLNRIRHERELQALRREIDAMKEANGKLEEDALLLLEELEKEKEALELLQAEVEELKSKVDTETEQLNVQIAKIEEEIHSEQSDREQLAAEIETDLCVRYERIFAKRGGLAVVEIRARTCQGCHMHIPPHMSNQILSNVQQNTGAIFHCPHCGRILVWKIEQSPPTQD